MRSKRVSACAAAAPAAAAITTWMRSNRAALEVDRSARAMSGNSATREKRKTIKDEEIKKARQVVG